LKAFEFLCSCIYSAVTSTTWRIVYSPLRATKGH